MKVVYTPAAFAELEMILAEIAMHSPKGSENVAARMKAIALLLSHHPGAGQMTSRKSLRRIVVNPYPYLIFYRIRENFIEIQGVRHSARDPRSMPR